MNIPVIILAVLIIVMGAALFVYSVCNYRNFILNRIMSFREAMDLCNVPIVTFEINDKRYNFILDTGSDTNIIDKRVADRLNLKSDKDSSVCGMDGNYVKTGETTVSLVYKERMFTDRFLIHDMSTVFDNIKREQGVSVHGILSSHFFRKYEYMLDFQKLIAYSKSRLF